MLALHKKITFARISELIQFQVEDLTINKIADSKLTSLPLI